MNHKQICDQKAAAVNAAAMRCSKAIADLQDRHKAIVDLVVVSDIAEEATKLAQKFTAAALITQTWEEYQRQSA